MRRIAAFLVPGMACSLAVPAVAAGEDHAESFRSVFEYCQTLVVSFDASGKPAAYAVAGLPERSAATGSLPDPETFAFERGAEGLGADPRAFAEWMSGERSVPGESAFAAGWDEGGVFVLSEHGSGGRCLKRYDIASGKADCLTGTNAERDVLGPVFLGPGGSPAILAGVRWRTESGTSNDWFDARMAAAERMLAERFPGSRPEWICPAPDDPLRWIVECRFADKPPVWAEADAGGGTLAVVASFPERISPMIRKVRRFRGTDGAELCGIVSFPDSAGPFPLVVFPHGGPCILSDDSFDERVWALVEGGFAVLQPNYRGSTGFGKRFRFEGWGPDGIRRALDDIFEMAVATLGDPALPVAKTKPLLLGGSWGGYCVLEQLARHPDFYAGGVSFFGAFDLPALVRSEMDRTAAGGSPDAERVMQTLARQFGDPSDAQAMERLAALSPVNHAGAIAAPVVLFHNREDDVVPFAQSEAMFRALANGGCPAEFRAGEGGHGFSSAEEAGIYAGLVSLFRSWIGAADSPDGPAPGPLGARNAEVTTAAGARRGRRGPP